MMSALLWGALASFAVVWPSRIVGPLDGAPLDTAAEVVLFGLVLPLAWLLHPRAVVAQTPRLLVSGLLLWKLATWLLLTQQGLCATFALNSGLPDHQVLRRSWDFRTPDSGGLPQCSAVLTRSLHSRDEFPVWFLNLPVGRDRNVDTGQPRNVEAPVPADVQMTVAGFVVHDGTVEEIDHAVNLRDEWRFDMPVRRGLWNADFAAIGPPTTLDRIGSYLWFVTPVLAIALVGWIAWNAATQLHLTTGLVATLAAVTALCGVLGMLGEPYARLAVLALVPLLALSSRHFARARSVVLWVGVPLLTLLVTFNADDIGRVTMYTAGDDWQTFQRFAGRIFFEGFWLEGGERTFWQQPLYRWIAGSLHVLFGDSSIGEVIWDGFGLIALSTFAFVLVRSHAAPRWAVASAVGTLVTILLGPNWYLVGRGMAEISGAMWLSVAAFVLLRARHGHVGSAVAAGVLGTLAIYTRLNHLFLVVALVVLLLPAANAGAWIAPRLLLRKVSKRAILAYASILAIGVALFAARTWYYTGHFSVLYGTTRQFNSTGLGIDTIGNAAVWAQVLNSVLMVITVSDPPRFDPRSVLVVVGVAAAVLGVLRVPVLRDIPLAPVVLCLVAISSAFIARGLAYPGRFSLHLIPIAVAVTVLLAARVTGALR